MSSPIAVTSQVTLARGDQRPVVFATMQTTSHDWLIIRELRFLIDPLENAMAGVLNVMTQLGFLVDASITVGREVLTSNYVQGQRQDFVPIAMLGPRLWVNWQRIENQNVVPPLAPAGAGGAMLNTYTWTLPRPMLVPPNTPIGVTLRRSGQTLADGELANLSPFSVEVTALGERLSRRPAETKRCLPYVAHWQPSSAEFARSVESGDAPFRNWFMSDLHVVRMMVQYMATSEFVQGIGAPGWSLPTREPIFRLYDASSQDIFVYTPNLGPNLPTNGWPQTVWLALANSVTMKDTLRPGQWYRGAIGPVFNGSSPTAPDWVLPYVSLESYREVSL